MGEWLGAWLGAGIYMHYPSNDDNAISFHTTVYYLYLLQKSKEAT